MPTTPTAVSIRVVGSLVITLSGVACPNATHQNMDKVQSPSLDAAVTRLRRAFIFVLPPRPFDYPNFHSESNRLGSYPYN